MVERASDTLNDVFDPLNLPEVGSAYDELYTVILCPVCHHKTLDCHYVCPTCSWAYDGFPEDQFSAENGATLRDYRKAYIRLQEEANHV